MNKKSLAMGFIEYLSEEKLSKGEALEHRNKQIDFDSIIPKALAERFPMSKDHPHVRTILDHIKSRHTFSKAWMMDNTDVPAGWCDHAFKVAKDHINRAGLGKTGTSTKSQTQAERIDAYLKQKQIGRVR